MKGLYSKISIGGDIDVEPLTTAVGWAPIGMPFINMSDHWKALRTNVAGVFHEVFMLKYFENFKLANKNAFETIGNEATVSIGKFMHDLTYESASIGLFGAKIEA